jgi:hypothetical protein
MCFGPMSYHASLCISCSGRRIGAASARGGYSAETMDRHHRWTVLLELGFTLRELIDMRPFLFSWRQIVEIAGRAWWENERE